MPLVDNQVRPGKAASRALADTFEIWNRKVHYYLGLYFLFFLWLFSLTGLLLNHHWQFAEFWPNRRVSTLTRKIEAPPPASQEQQAKGLMRQLGITGEIDWTGPRADAGRLEFRANRPGHSYQIKADLTRGQAEVEYTKLNGWGIAHILHTFTGVRMADSRNQRDWALTTAWALSMDAFALGLVIMVLSSLYMWYGLKQKRRFGAIALGLGALSCGFFVFGLRWLA